MPAAKRLAGVAPEVVLRENVTIRPIRLPTLALKPGGVGNIAVSCHIVARARNPVLDDVMGVAVLRSMT